MTEWSITNSVGISGLMLRGSPPNAAIASRIATMSTTHGTPVKSCISTLAGVNRISVLCVAASVPVPQEVFQQYLQVVGQSCGALERIESKDFESRIADVQFVSRTEAISDHG